MRRYKYACIRIQNVNAMKDMIFSCGILLSISAFPLLVTETKENVCLNVNSMLIHQ